MNEYNLQAIYDYANEVLEQANPEDIDGAINWGDLSCTDVEVSVSVHGWTGIRVTIEECDPYNPELREFMHKKLTDKFPDIAFEINTEW